MAKIIDCPCGWTVRADSDEELIKEVQQHAKEVHNQEATREQVLAMARND